MSPKETASKSSITRRDVIAGAGAASLGLACGEAGGAQPSSPGTAVNRSDSHREHPLRGIDPKDIVDEYERRRLGTLSDSELYRQAAGVISVPPAKGQTSFTLHAPLELVARYGLLPLVDPEQRRLARLQMATSAAAFGAGVEPAAAPEAISPFGSLGEASREFARTFQSADPVGLEAVTLQIANQFGTASLVQLLTPLALPTLTGASHSHIGLWLLLRHGAASDVGGAALLRAGVRQLASKPELQLRSFSGMAVSGGTPLKMTGAQIEREILAKLTDPPKGEHKSNSMFSLFELGEKTGNADTLFGDFIRHDLSNEQIDAAFRAVLRVCAHSMLQDDVGDAKFGWSHCLTLPQAACGLSSLNLDRKLALASTLVWIVAYRSVRSRIALDFDWAPERLDHTISLDEALHTSPRVAAARVWHADEAELPEVVVALATQASIRNDQHLAKYTRACLDLGGFDPTHRRLYLAGAAHLGALWIGERPADKILDHLMVRRDTPG